MTSECECFGCKSKQNIAVREFRWHYRPREKYRLPPRNEVNEWKVLKVNLCDTCYVNTQEVDYLIGWDWWDAIDGLHLS